jgi:opacity protein-like surface antigen
MNTNRSSYALGAVLGSALMLVLGAPAMAADIYDGGGLKGGYEVPPPPSDRGFYFKGFVGQANPDSGNMWNSGYDTNEFTVHHNDIKSSPLYGIGFGWQARHWLRFDVTGEYRGDTTYFGSDQYPGNGFPAGTNEYTADMKSWLGLVNAYIDMGNWCGFTPYIGAGIGFSNISVEGFKDVNVPNEGVAFGADKNTSNFAYAFYAGASFDVTERVALDLSYRWVNMGNASTGDVTAFDGSSTYGGHHIKDITSNDLLLGVRYKLQREPVSYMPVK